MKKILCGLITVAFISLIPLANAESVIKKEPMEAEGRDHKGLYHPNSDTLKAARKMCAFIASSLYNSEKIEADHFIHIGAECARGNIAYAWRLMSSRDSLNEKEDKIDTTVKTEDGITREVSEYEAMLLESDYKLRKEEK